MNKLLAVILPVMIILLITVSADNFGYSSNKNSGAAVKNYFYYNITANITQNITNYANTSELDPRFTAENASLWSTAKSKYNLTYDKWAYNQTVASSGDGSYNATYAPLAYNHTIAVNTLYGQWFYNQTTSSTGDGSYNSTYAPWAYNQTTGTYNIYGLNWYNHTVAVNSIYGKWFYNQTYSGSTYNATYAGYAPNVYNHTSSINTLYGKWFYNQTSLMNYTNIGMTNQTNTWTGANQIINNNLTVSNSINLVSGRITSNSTCVIIQNGGTELAICQ